MQIELVKENDEKKVLEEVAGFTMSDKTATITFVDETFLVLKINSGVGTDYQGNKYKVMNVVQEIKF